MKTKIGKHTQIFNPNDNGGESVGCTSTLYNNGDGPGGFYCIQEFFLNSYGNEASLHVGSFTLTPKMLRDWADKLDSFLFYATDGDLP